MIKRLKSFCKNGKFVNNLKNVLVVFSYVIIAIALMSSFSFADEDGFGSDSGKKQDIETTINDGMEKVQSLMFKFSTGAVVIAVGCGVFIKKFSMGKQDKIELGNKLIRDSIIGFIVLNAMPIIATTVQGFLKEEGGAGAVNQEQASMIMEDINNVKTTTPALNRTASRI